MVRDRWPSIAYSLLTLLLQFFECLCFSVDEEEAEGRNYSSFSFLSALNKVAIFINSFVNKYLLDKT